MCPLNAGVFPVSLDRSLKSKSTLQRHRNVLTRAERLDKLAEEDRWSESNSVFGLPKVAHRKAGSGKKAKKEEEATAEAGEAAPEAAETKSEG